MYLIQERAHDKSPFQLMPTCCPCTSNRFLLVDTDRKLRAPDRKWKELFGHRFHVEHVAKSSFSWESYFCILTLPTSQYLTCFSRSRDLNIYAQVQMRIRRTSFMLRRLQLVLVNESTLAGYQGSGLRTSRIDAPKARLRYTQWKLNDDKLDHHLVSRNVGNAHLLLGSSTMSSQKPATFFLHYCESRCHRDKRPRKPLLR